MPHERRGDTGLTLSAAANKAGRYRVSCALRRIRYCQVCSALLGGASTPNSTQVSTNQTPATFFKRLEGQRSKPNISRDVAQHSKPNISRDLTIFSNESDAYFYLRHARLSSLLPSSQKRCNTASNTKNTQNILAPGPLSSRQQIVRRSRFEYEYLRTGLGARTRRNTTSSKDKAPYPTTLRTNFVRHGHTGVPRCPKI